jgi:glucosamine-6-phosphate deaminase
VVADTTELSRAGADLVATVIRATPSASVVVATGRTPEGMYEELVGRRRSNSFDPTGITAFQMDEYLGLRPNDRRSLFGWMDRTFLAPLEVTDDRVVRLPIDGDRRACAAYDRAIEDRGGLDLAILGLGPNGHLAFNEPPSSRDSVTRAVDLSPATIEANARYWGTIADVPTRAVTIGMAQLLSARTILMLVSGRNKRSIVHRALEGEVEPAVPASFLQEADADVTVIVDHAAWGNDELSSP